MNQHKKVNNIKNRIMCFIFGHWHENRHDFQKIVTCDRCGNEIRATYDFISPGYQKV